MKSRCLLKAGNGFQQIVLKMKQDKTVIYIKEQPWGAQELVEIPVPVGATGRVQLPDVQQLRNYGDQKIIIQGIRLITASVLTNGVITGATNAPATEIKKISLNLYSEQWEKGHFMPIGVFNDTHVEGDAFPYRQYATDLDNWEDVDWSKSYLQYSSGTAPAGTPYCLMLQVAYLRWSVKLNQEVIGPA